MKQTQIDQLTVNVYDDKKNLGEAAAGRVTGRLEQVLRERGHANLLLATGASQFEFLEAFRQIDRLDWSGITTFHLDEYVGLSEEHPASFRRYLHERIIDHVQPGQAYFLTGDTGDLQAEIQRYEQLLNAHPIDVACIGIGENGHIAFNDPPVADFEDPHLVKVVQLDEKSRRQQVGEGWFDTLEDVPRQALSLTIPAIMQSRMISCVVPDRRKADAVYDTLYGPVSTECPASILRTHEDTILYLDQHSAKKIVEDLD